MRAAAPAARKPTCLRRPVIRADGEFWRGGSLRSEGRICVNPREFNVTKKEACRNSVGFEPFTLNAAAPNSIPFYVTMNAEFYTILPATAHFAAVTGEAR